MNKAIKNMAAGLLLICILALAGPGGLLTAWAGNTKIAFSDPSVMVGNDVSVTVKVTSDTALGSAEIMLSYDPNVLEFVSGTNANGGAGAIKLLGTMDTADQKDFSFSLKFKTLQAGSTQIAVASQEIYDVDSAPVPLDKQGTSTVKVTSPATYSKDATLKSLKISPGNLSPEFSPSVESYTASVDGAADHLVVNAVAANANASVSLQGAEGLKTGENQVVVKVTAEDKQTVRNYTILVTKEEGETAPTEEQTSGETREAQLSDITVAIDGVDYTVASSFDEAALPEGFEAESYTFKGTEVMAGKGLEKDLLLLYLKDNGGNGGFYIYNESSDSWILFVQLVTSGKSVVIIPYDNEVEMPEDFAERQISIDNNLVNAWVMKDDVSPKYCVVYGINWDGQKNFYRYDLEEKTIQRYFAGDVSLSKYTEMAKTYNGMLKNYYLRTYICLGLGALCVILLIVIVLLLIKKERGGRPDGRGGHGRINPDFEYMEEQTLVSGDRDYEAGLNPDPVGESYAGNVRRYSRDAFESQDIPAEITLPDPEPAVEAVDTADEDDFEEAVSLEDMEKEIRMPRPPRQTKAQPSSAGDDDDFEMMDLDE